MNSVGDLPSKLLEAVRLKTRPKVIHVKGKLHVSSANDEAAKNP
jgi:hypothetical protein